MISCFCIDRPIFATVMSLVITLAGTLALLVLPVAQYPAVTPPTVQVACSYPGASAQVVADTVAAPIEQQVNGVEGMLYMSSTSGNDGSYTLTVTFGLGTDLNTALVMVQNRVALATPQLPTSVQRQGLSIRKKTPDLLLVVNFVSPDGRYDNLYLSNYATINVKDELLRIDGVADINYLGERDYSIRAWLDPQKMAAHRITVNEVAAAVRDQSTDPAAGQTGAQPAAVAGGLTLPLGALGRLTHPDQFDDVIVKVATGAVGSPSPGVLRLRDLARVELAAQSYTMNCTLDGQPSVGLAIHQLPESNALVVAAAVRKRMDELSERFPAGLEYRIHYDTTPFIRESLRDLVRTLLQAVGLVAVVVLLFLQDWRAALIPMAAVPVAILGTFAVMAAFGYSLNTISLFGLVLAIGIVVDDAIVVLENVQRWLDQGLPPREAAQRAMAEVTGPIVAVALVLGAVFVPCAFIPGIPGQFFRQFAVTIAASTALSALNSLTLSPALAALLLRQKTPAGVRRFVLLRPLHWFYGCFNRLLAGGTAAYTRLVGHLLLAPVIGVVLYVLLLALTGWAFAKAPTGFIPPQDQGHCFVTVELPDAASLQRTREVMAQVEALTRATPGVANTCTISGTSLVFGVNAPNFGTMFVVLKPFAERRPESLHVDAVMADLRRAYQQHVKDAEVSVLGAPPVPGISLAGGLKLMVEDRAALGPAFLQKQADALADRLRPDAELAAVSSPFRGGIPQLYLEIDRPKVLALGVALQDVDDALQTYLGATYANSFNEFGRFWQVNLMADGRYRRRTDDIGQLQVRNRLGEMVPLSTLLRVRDSSGPVMIQRYNLYNAAPLTAWLRWNAGSQETIARIDAQARQALPRTMNVEWTDLTYFQIRAGDTALYAFLLGVVFAFLALAALYESWSLPLAVILVVPLCLLSAVVGVVLGGRMAVNLFVQIGFVVLIGLACKNAILIVEFAKQRREAGVEATAAVLEACTLRLRPILMTSLALILGVLPLVLAVGAGAEMRRSLGLAVFSGMIGVTLFGVFLTPLFFHLLDREAPKAPQRSRIRAIVLAGSAVLVGVGLGRLADMPPLRSALLGAVLAGAIGAVLYCRRRPAVAGGSGQP